jgi:hypothetical protein
MAIVAMDRDLMRASGRARMIRCFTAAVGGAGRLGQNAIVSITRPETCLAKPTVFGMAAKAWS